jgi:mono/diheme cytochrome c family protein
MPARRVLDSKAATSVVALLTAVAVTPARAQSAPDLFRQTCASCHTIGGGRLTGPDLKNVTERRDLAWLERFLPDPKAFIDSGDPTAVALVQDAHGVVMPTFPVLTPAKVHEILDFLSAESKLPRSAFAGSPVSDRPFTPQDVAHGRSLFVGTTRLQRGGPPCISCHSVGHLGALGGGQLGPDLTQAIERLQGRKGLTAWLGAPATSTMQSVFQPTPLQPDEILSVVAYLDQAARTEVPVAAVGQINFFLLGLGGAVIGLVAADAVWKRRFRAVRRPLVRGELRGGAR